MSEDVDLMFDLTTDGFLLHLSIPEDKLGDTDYLCRAIRENLLDRIERGNLNWDWQIKVSGPHYVDEATRRPTDEEVELVASTLSK